jgi:hypothetical protein
LNLKIINILRYSIQLNIIVREILTRVPPLQEERGLGGEAGRRGG